MIKKITNYIRDDGFKFNYFDNRLDVVNYEKILVIEDKLIEILYKNGVFVVSGNNLSIIRLLDEEVLIEGKIVNIELR